MIDLIEKNDIGSKTLVSSFSPSVLKLFVKATQPADERSFLISPLLNYGGTKEDREKYKAPDFMDGINIAYPFMTRERVATVRQANKLIGVYTGSRTPENRNVWDNVFTMEDGAVNFFISDKPLEAIKARNILQAKNGK